MEKLFWILEYAKVAFAYFFVTFLWPMIVFRKFLKGKSRTFRFAFCVGPQMILLSTVMLLMGLIGILNGTTFKILFWGVFVVSLLWDFRPGKNNIKRLKNFFSGTYGVKSAVTDILGSIKKLVSGLFKSFKEFMNGRWFEFILLLLIIIYAVIYFSYGAFYDTSYGTGDLYTHNMWTYELCNGQAFSHGVYPEGMHCFLGAEHMAFGIDLYSLVLFTAGIHISVIIIAMYIFLKNLFSWKYAPQILLVLYFIIDVKNMDAIFSFCRYQWTLPQEFGYPALFMCAVYLLKFLKKDYDEESLKVKKILKNEELFIFLTTLAATFAMHFYVTIMAFLVCVPIAIVLIKKLIGKKFLPLCVSAVAGILVATVPMATAFITGTPLEGSLYWAMSIMSSESDEEESSVDTEAGKQAVYDNGLKSAADVAGDNGQRSADYGTFGDDGLKTASYTGKTAALTFLTQAVDAELAEETSGFFETIYERSFSLSFGDERAKKVFAAFIASVITWIISFVIVQMRKKKNEEDDNGESRSKGYLMLIGIMVIFDLMFMLRALNLPVIIDETRLYPFQQLFSYAMFLIPVDFIYSFITKDRYELVSKLCGAAGVLVVFLLVVYTGSYHGYLMCQLTRYNESSTITKSIVNQMKPESYTIVSTSDEIYQFIGHGYHEELISFVNQSEIISYTLPTEYVYLYIEKNPLSRNQYNFYSGPGWLASEKYNKIFGAGYSSFGRNVNCGAINEDMANIYFGPFPYSSDVYATQWKRTALMAKAYVWCQKFNEMYPNELHVFYEDDNMVVYYFKQNQRNIYELAVMDSTAMIKPSEYPKPFWPAGDVN